LITQDSYESYIIMVCDNNSVGNTWCSFTKGG
jgi:hypothetical protein